MSRGLGRIGRAIAHKIECARLLESDHRQARHGADQLVGTDVRRLLKS